MLTRIFTALLLLVLVAPAAAAQDALAFNATTHDFGEIMEGDVATTTFTFTNESTAPVRLLEVRPSCGCTAPDWSREPVAPGEAGSVTVAYDSSGRPGVFSRDVTVRAETVGEDGSTALDPVSLTVTGTVTVTTLAGGPQQGSLMFSADAHDFGTVSPGRVVYTFLVQNKGDRPVRLQGAAVYGGEVEVVLPDTPLFVGDLAEIFVAVNTDAVAGEAFDIAVVLDTTDETQPKKSLRLTGRMAAGE
ncbi:MAG: DUF1573 domain-containing protein [Bacteroidota bacterium]